ncbi:coenzyme F420-0:L-glutamate ligase [Candidatus Woesebacteria bacterium]|nr:coenzyme F420-0:L-glutamate ligase [Candidatus Woesebacteria bacterium]
MIVTPIKTTVLHINDDFFAFLDKFVPKDLENKVLVVTSKVLALSEGSVVKPSGKYEKHSDEVHEIAKKLVDAYTEPTDSKYNIMLTIIHNTLLMNGGIDSSNAQQHFVLLPKDPYKWATDIWNYLRKKHNLKNFGVIVTDSHAFPLKWGSIGTALAFCGFKSLHSKIGEADLFGRKLEMTYVGVAEGIAVAAVLEMGEAAEAQPLCIVENIGQIEFVDHQVTKEEIDFINIDIEDDAFAPILKKADWKKYENK